jgi:hypothetical protein
LIRVAGSTLSRLPATRINDRDFQPGPFMKRARQLYLDWAKTRTR